MSVKHQHNEYTDMMPKWQRCIDVCAGQDAIHDAGPAYLPALADQDNAEYQNYKNRAPFYNATWRTIVGLQGMIFRKPPAVTVPDIVKEMLDDITMDGTPMHLFALNLAEECLKLGRVGVWVDFPVAPDGATEADAKIGNFRPSMKKYVATSIINWKTKTINNKTMLSMIVLKEMKYEAVDQFEDKEKDQYRVLDLTTDNEGLSYYYRVRIFEIKIDPETQEEVDVLISTAIPKIKGKVLDTIPFQFMGVDDVNWCVDEPPLIDLVDMNLSHYRSTADYEHGCHFTGLPTPVISGYQNDPANPTKFYIGSMTAWVFTNPQAKASYLEFTGQGLGALKENIDGKANYMAVLGARMLEAQIKGVEAADTAAIHRGGEQSMLSSVAQSISMGIQKALKTFCDFAGAKGDVKFELNRDFFPVPMDALTLTAIIAGWQNHAYSYETMFENLKKGEIVPVDRTIDEEQVGIKKNPPPVLEAPTTPGNGKTAVKKPKAAKGSAGGAAPTITQLQK
jgi:hypothetical protein